MFKVEVEFNKLPELGKRVHEELSQEAWNIARRIRDDAAANAPVRTGALRASIRMYQISSLVREVEAGVDYAHLVEFGTYRKGPRPFLSPAVEKEAGKIASAIGGAVERAVRG